MAPRSPEQVFGDAQAAMERGDWVGFFRCLETKDLLRLGANHVAGLLNEQPNVSAAFARLREDHAIPLAALEGLRALTREMMESAQRIRDTGGLGGSEGHRLLVKRYQKSVSDLLKAIADLPAFLGQAEAASRDLFGGGSVSSRLFVGEALEDVAIDGNRGWATRVGTTSAGARWTEDVGFVRDRSGTWRIKLFAGRSRRPRTV